MSSSADSCTARRLAALSVEAERRQRKFWPSIIWIVIIEVVALAALAGVFVAYLNWSSEANFAEFLAASQTQAAPSPVSQVRAPCEQRA
jgi:flagellar basal body-associated protein FliL